MGVGGDAALKHRVRDSAEIKQPFLLRMLCFDVVVSAGIDVIFFFLDAW